MNVGLRSALRTPGKWIPLIALEFLLTASFLSAQVTVTRTVVSGGGGSTGTTGHTLQGTLSQTAVGRLTNGGDIQRHDVGFWYNALPPEVITTISLPTIETNVETRVKIELRLESLFPRPYNRPFIPRPFTARIRFNGTLLHPINATPTCSWDGDDCVIDISDTARTENGVIATLEFITALGNAESTVLEIEDFDWWRIGEEHISIVKKHGSLKLLDVCRVGDQIRLIQTGSAPRLTVWPNPAVANATIECTPNESGTMEIRLVDVLGTDAAPPLYETVEADRIYSKEFDLSNVPSGTYMLICRLPSTTMTRRLIVRQ